MSIRMVAGKLGIIDRESSLRRVDLNPSAALIPFKLLILRYAKLAQLAKTANLSYTLTFNPAMTRDLHSAAVPFITTVLVPPETLRAYQNCFLPRNGK